MTSALPFIAKVGPLHNIVHDKNVGYKNGHFVLPKFQSRFKTTIFYMPEISGIYLVHSLIS
jgi:hypothetical protein